MLVLLKAQMSYRICIPVVMVTCLCRLATTDQATKLIDTVLKFKQFEILL